MSSYPTPAVPIPEAHKPPAGFEGVSWAHCDKDEIVWLYIREKPGGELTLVKNFGPPGTVACPKCGSVCTQRPENEPPYKEGTRTDCAICGYTHWGGLVTPFPGETSEELEAREAQHIARVLSEDAKKLSPEVAAWMTDYAKFIRGWIAAEHAGMPSVRAIADGLAEHYAAREVPEPIEDLAEVLDQVATTPLEPEARELTERIKAAGKYGCDGCYLAIREVAPLVEELHGLRAERASWPKKALAAEKARQRCVTEIRRLEAELDTLGGP